jgi:maltose alpha-D-glucosyltransferase/alpha-amylase
MQWANQPGAGFSTTEEKHLHPAVIAEGPYGYPVVNVASLERDPKSLVNRIERLIRARKQYPEFGWGEPELLTTSNESVLAYGCTWQTVECSRFTTSAVNQRTRLTDIQQLMT